MKNIGYLFIFLPFLVQGQSFRITTSSDTICAGASVSFFAADSGFSSPHFQWRINAMNAGADTTCFTTHALNNGDTVTCLLTNAAHDTTYAVSNSLIMTVEHPLDGAGGITGRDSLCVGSTAVLNDTIRGGTWVASNANASISGDTVKGLTVVNAEENTLSSMDTIFYIVSNSCGADSASFVVNIIPLPDAFFYLSPDGSDNWLCVGQTATLDDMDGYPYLLYSLNGDIACYPGGEIRAIEAGNDVLVGVCTNFCGTDTGRVPVEVYSIPVPGVILDHKDSICRGDTIHLADTSYAFGDPSWSGGNDIVSVNAGTGIVTGLAAGEATVFFVSTNYCGYRYVGTTITVNPPYPIITPVPFCSGNFIALVDSSESGTWSSENPEIAAIDPVSGVVAGVSAGTASITYRLPNGCATETTVEVKASPAPISGYNLVCIGAETTLTDPGNGNWTTNDQAISINNLQYGTITGISNGYATITYTLSNGCYDTLVVGVIDCSTPVTLFPNPVTTELVLQADTLLFNNIIIYNILGQRVWEQRFSEMLTTIQTGNFIPGIYFLYLTGEVELNFYAKFEKQ